MSASACVYSFYAWFTYLVKWGDLRLKNPFRNWLRVNVSLYCIVTCRLYGLEIGVDYLLYMAKEARQIYWIIEQKNHKGLNIQINSAMFENSHTKQDNSRRHTSPPGSAPWWVTLSIRPISHAPYGHYGQIRRHPQNREYITYCIVVTRIDIQTEVVVQLQYTHRQTEQTVKHSTWYTYNTSTDGRTVNTLHLYRGWNKQELSSCWVGRPFGHNRHWPKRGVCCAPLQTVAQKLFSRSRCKWQRICTRTARSCYEFSVTWCWRKLYRQISTSLSLHSTGLEWLKQHQLCTGK